MSEENINNKLNELFSDLFSASEEEAFVIDNPELEKEVRKFFCIMVDRFAFDDLKVEWGGKIQSEELLKFICENNLLDNIKGKIELSLASLDNFTDEELELIFNKLNIKEFQLNTLTNRTKEKLVRIAEKTTIAEMVKLTLPSVGSFTDEELKLILTNLNVNKLYLSDLTGITKEKLKIVVGKCIIDGDSRNYDETYDMETLSEIVKVLEKIKKSIPENVTELEKFLSVYKAVGMLADYDNSGCTGNELSTEESVSLTRSLKGVLLEGRAVCVGYALALKYALQCVGLEAKKISGHAYAENGDGGHAWNQLKIDNSWYNVDLTWDYKDLREGKELKYCLKSDEEFCEEHVADEMESCEKCESSYSSDEIQNALRYIVN